MHKSAQIPKQAVDKLQRERAGLFLPDALCLKKKVLTDSWAPGPYSARVQCGCLANEVDHRDYNQTGNISVLMCQSRRENLPVLQCQSELFQLPIGSYLPYNNTEPCHGVPRAALRRLRARAVTVNGRRSYGGKSHHGSNSKAPVDTEGSPKHTNYLLSAFLAVKCGLFNLAVFNLPIIIQQKVVLKLGLNTRFCAEMY